MQLKEKPNQKGGDIPLYQGQHGGSHRSGFILAAALTQVTRLGKIPLVEVSNALASKDLGAKAGDLLELVRNDDKQRYEVGELAGSRYIKAHQGHSRPEVGTADLLEKTRWDHSPRHNVASLSLHSGARINPWRPFRDRQERR